MGVSDWASRPAATDSGILRPAPPLPLPAVQPCVAVPAGPRVTPASALSPLTSQSPLTSPQFNYPFITANDLFTSRIKPRICWRCLFVPLPCSRNSSNEHRKIRHHLTCVLFDSDDSQKKKKGRKNHASLRTRVPPTGRMDLRRVTDGGGFCSMGGFLVAAG